MSGARALAGARSARIAGGLATHALLAWHLGAGGYGLLALATSMLGLLRLIEFVPPAALATFVPLLLGEQRAGAARSVVWFTWGASGVTALATSTALWLLHGELGAWFGNEALGDVLLAVAIWNLVGVARGPLDPELLLGLRAWPALLCSRLLENAGLVAAAVATVLLRGDAATYYHCAALLQLPLVLWSWSRLRLLAPLRAGAAEPVLRRYLKFCLPIAGSQQLFKLYASCGAPLLASFGSLGAAGAYRLAATVADLTSELLAAVPQAHGPELAVARAGRDLAPLWQRVAQEATAWALPASLALVAGAPLLAILLGPAQFGAAVPLLVLFAPQVYLRTVSHPAALLAFAQERPGVVTTANLAKVALELALAWLLVPGLGAAGMVTAHGLAAAASMLLLYRAAGRSVAVPPELRATSGIGLLFVVAAVDVQRGGLFAPALLAAVAALWFLRLRPRQTSAGVTLVCNSRAVGGVERHMLDLTRGLAARGIGVDLIAPQAATASWRERMQAAGVRVIHVAGVDAPWDLRGWIRLARVLGARSGLLHFHLNSMDDQAPGLLLARLLGRGPIVATLQLGRGDRPARWSPKGIRRRIALPIADRMLCVASALRDAVVARHGVDPERVRVVPNGVDVDALAPDDGLRASVRRRLGVPQAEPVLLFAGRLTPVKGVAVLLDALQKLPQPPAVWIAGDGPERQRLEAAAAGLPVRFLGWRDDVRDLLRAADGLVLPSFHEGMPLVVLEGMAAGLPVLATAVAGTPEAVRHGEHGWLFPPGEPTALACAIAEWVKVGDAGRRKIGANGRARALAEFRVERQIDATLRAYGELVPVPEAIPEPSRNDLLLAPA